MYNLFLDETNFLRFSECLVAKKIIRYLSELKMGSTGVAEFGVLIGYADSNRAQIHEYLKYNSRHIFKFSERSIR